jgi:anti-sigma factor RsiW
MNADHVALSDLELYVIGALDVARQAEVEHHVSGCAACAAALAREARLETAFAQIAERPSRPNAAPVRRTARHRPLLAVGSAVVGALSMAAAVLVWVGRATAIDMHPAGGPSLGAHAVDIPRPVHPLRRARRLEDASESTASIDAMCSLDDLDGG